MIIGCRCSLLHILELSLDQTRDTDLCANLDLGGSHLGIIGMFAEFTGLLHLTVTATIAGSVVAKDFYGHLAGMEAAAAGAGLLLFVFLADLILKSTALQVLVETLVGCDCICHLPLPPFLK